MPATPTTLLLPVETLNREFDGKLLLALAAAERGWKPIIGGRTRMHASLPSLPRSVYLAKGVRSGSRAIFARLERMGHRIVALDEEALVRFSDDLFLMKLDPETFGRVRVFFAWGQDNADIWRRFHGYRNAPIVEAGNPRADMMRPELRGFHAPVVDGIRARFGDFVLFNSNFSVVNHFIPNRTRFKVADWAPEERTDRFKSGMLGHKQRLFEAFLALLPQLSERMRPYNIVIRPHPSENWDTWRHAAAGLPNVHVVHEGAVVPWLIAARALLHNGCTSAIEAAVIGTPAFAYRPHVLPEFDLALPNELSTDCRDAETLLAGLRRTLDAGTPVSRPLSAGQETRLRHLIASVDGALSCERILDALDAHRDLLAPSEANWRSWLVAYWGHRKRLLRRAMSTRRQDSSSSALYTAHKFPGIGPDEVNARIAGLQAALSRFAGLRARQIRRDIFAIERP